MAIWGLGKIVTVREGASVSLKHFHRLAAKMDQHMHLLAAEGITDPKVIIDRMVGYLPDLHTIWVGASDDELLALTEELPGFYIFASVMEEAFEAERRKPSRPYDDLAPFSEDDKSRLMGLLDTAATLERGLQTALGEGQPRSSRVDLEKLHRQWLLDVEAFKAALRAKDVDPRAIGYINEAFGQVEARLKTLTG